MLGLSNITVKIAGVFITYQTLFVNFERQNKEINTLLPDDHDGFYETVSVFTGCSSCLIFIREIC
jgi:hypothetical protein